MLCRQSSIYNTTSIRWLLAPSPIDLNTACVGDFSKCVILHIQFLSHTNFINNASWFMKCFCLVTVFPRLFVSLAFSVFRSDPFSLASVHGIGRNEHDMTSCMSNWRSCAITIIIANIFRSTRRIMHLPLHCNVQTSEKIVNVSFLITAWQPFASDYSFSRRSDLNPW